jgi:Spy/CpxP family protein refolding chaperone
MLILGSKVLGSKVSWVVGGGLAVLAFAVGAAAQTAQAPPVADAQVGFQHPAQLPPQEELAAADGAIAGMEQTATTVSRMLEQARAARDVVKTLCLNDKLSQIDVAIRSAKDRRSALQAAVGRNDQELSNHEFTILTVLRQRDEQLSAEANQCIGEEAAFVGATNVSTTIDNTLPPTDDTQYSPPDNTIVTYPPLSASDNGM